MLIFNFFLDACLQYKIFFCHACLAVTLFMFITLGIIFILTLSVLAPEVVVVTLLLCRSVIQHGISKWLIFIPFRSVTIFSCFWGPIFSTLLAKYCSICVGVHAQNFNTAICSHKL